MPTDRKAEKAAYYQAHKERHHEVARQWERDNKEKVNALHREAYHSNPEIRERARDRGRRNYEANKDIVNERARRWVQENAEKNRLQLRQRAHARRARMHSVVREPVSLTGIMLRDRMTCGICHKRVAKEEVSFDHIIPISKGGAHAEWNLQVAHLRCNISRGAGRLPAQTRLAL